MSSPYRCSRSRRSSPSGRCGTASTPLPPPKGRPATANLAVIPAASRVPSSSASAGLPYTFILVPPPAGPSRREWMQMNIQVLEGSSKRMTTCSPSHSSTTRARSTAIPGRLALPGPRFQSQSSDNGPVRKVSASHVRRLLPELPGGGPAYQRLAAGLRARTLAGRLPLGTRLPAERELAHALGISRTTTSAAYALLRREGYLTSRRGAGSFASFPTEPEPTQAGLPWLGEADESVIDLTVAAPTALAETFLEAAAVAVEQLPLHLRGDGDRVLGLPEPR